MSILIPIGTLVTYNGIAGITAGRRLEDDGYWIRPLSGPKFPFPLSELQIERGLLDGSFRQGAETGDLHEEYQRLATVDPGKISDRDESLKDYLALVIHTVEAEIARNPKAARRRGELISSVLSAVRTPEGIRPLKAATILKHMKKYRHSGRNEAALYPKHAYKGNRVRRKPDFVLDAIERAIDNKFRGPGSLPHVVTEAIGIAKRELPNDLSEYTKTVRLGDGNLSERSMIPRNKTGEIDWEELVSYPAVRRAVKSRDTIDIAMRIHGPREARRKLAVKGAGQCAKTPLETAETDDTWLSRLFVVDDENWFPLGIPCYTAIIDQASRCILGHVVSFMPPSSDGVGRVLQRALMPKDLSWTGTRPDGSAVITNRWNMFGTIIELKCDQGPGFISHHTRDNAYRCGTALTVLPPGSPQLKPYIERYFGTLKRSSLADALGMLPKKLLDALARSGKRRKGPVLITLRELELLLTYWVVDVYHQAYHRSLGTTPQEAWDKLSREKKTLLPPPREHLALLTGKYEPSRTVNANGVRILGLEYNSAALGTLRQTYGDPQTGILRDFEIKYDPSDISVVWVLAPDPRNRKRTLAVPAQCKQMHYARGLDEYRHVIIKAHARTKKPKGILSMNELIEAKLELAELARKMIKSRNAGGGSKILARTLNINRGYLSDPESEEQAEASRQFLSLVKDEPIDDGAPVAAQRKTPATPQPAKDGSPTSGREPAGTELLRNEKVSRRRNLGVIRDV